MKVPKAAALLGVVLAFGCRAEEANGEPRASAPAPATDAPPPIDARPSTPSAGRTVASRFEVPPGFRRVDAEPGSFAAFSRRLPMKPPGAPVVDYRGRTLHADHDGVAGVVDIDVGTRDLQQCADAVIRMNAEWRYDRGERDVTYRAASGTTLSYRAWLAGDRAVLASGALSPRRAASPRADSHAAYREWLDEVFTWANTASLERDGVRVALARVAPGDFFVEKGVPIGHAVLVLDVAKDASGKTALLLGQSFMPAQSFHVLRPSRRAAWFVVDETTTEVATPFWTPFAVGSLRRLPAPAHRSP
ncbi:MAG: hypothetical protein KF819_13235 [Labilithrix sp.]|nr:hypothetical protein [Labilithrix sp.]